MNDKDILKRFITEQVALALEEGAAEFAQSGLDIEWQVDKLQDFVHVALIVKNQEEWLKQHGYSRGMPENREAGFLMLSREEIIKGTCMENVQALHDEVFGGEGPPNVWAVASAGLRLPGLQNQGLGTQMYLKAFEAVAPAIVVADKCAGGSTSSSAERVWSSLKRRFPHKGKSAGDLAFAITGKG